MGRLRSNSAEAVSSGRRSRKYLPASFVHVVVPMDGGEGDAAVGRGIEIVGAQEGVRRGGRLVIRDSV